MTTPVTSPATTCPPCPPWFENARVAVPVLPAVAHKVIEMAADPEVSVARLASLITKDQVLAARVLGLANSAYSASLQTITTVTDAIVRIGMMSVRNVVVTVCYSSKMHDPQVYGHRGQALVDHAVGTAYLARLVADRAGVDVEEAFLYGLLHDIGKLVILKLAHDHKRRENAAVPEAELEQALRQHHAEMGGMALRRMNLPEELDEPVRHHHEYLAAATRPREAAVAYCANRLSHRFGFGCTPQDDIDILADPVAELLGLDEPWVAELEARAPGLFEVARQALN